MASLRLGVDLGGTKIEAGVLDAQGRFVLRQRCSTPQGDYAATLAAIIALVQQVEAQLEQGALPTGLCTPGSISPHTGLLRNANSTCLNGQALQQDLQAGLQRELRLANDADCLALSEAAADGAAAGAHSVFAVILGTGVGGGIALHGQLHHGANAIAGEWGHNSLPWPKQDFNEIPGQPCWCGQHGCIETWLSGPALLRDAGRGDTQVPTLLAAADADDWQARAALGRYEDRLARALASIINLLDPQVIVLGGGVSNLARLYTHVPRLWLQYVFAEHVTTQLLPAKHGDSSGVRGAAWLWPAEG